MQILRRQQNVWQRLAVFEARPNQAIKAAMRQGGMIPVRCFSALPEHDVVGLPALSPVSPPPPLLQRAITL